GHGLADGRLAWFGSPLADLAVQRRLLFGRTVALGVGGDEHPAVVDADEAVSDGDLDGFTVEPHSDRVEGAGEADLAGPGDAAGRGRLLDKLDRFDWFAAGETEPFPRDDVTDALMTAIVVIGVHPPVQLRLGVGDGVEHLAVEELDTHRLVPAFHL